MTTKATKDRPLLSIEQVAAELTVSRATAYRYVERGLLTAIPLVPNGSAFDPGEVRALKGRLRKRVRQKAA